MSTKRMRILVLEASSRPGARAPIVAAWFRATVAETARALDIELVPLSLADLALPFLDEDEPWSGRYRFEHTRRWAEIVDGVDGFVTITPEYNYSMPAVLKNALDFLGPEWAWKPMGFVSYGNTSAGTRSVQHAKQAITTLRIVPVGATVAMRIADTLPDRTVRTTPALERSATRVLEEVVAVARALEPLRRAREAVDESAAGPIPGLVLRRLDADDAADLSVLSRASWVDEAIENGTLDIPALHESLEEVVAGLAEWPTWGLFDSARLVGTVRARVRDGVGVDGGAVGEVGRLAVAADARGRGTGARLLRFAEQRLIENGARRLELHTGSRSARNLAFYGRRGWRLVSAPDAPYATLEKELPTQLPEPVPSGV